MAEPLIQVENLCKYFQVSRDRVLKAVDGVSFTIQPQEHAGSGGRVRLRQDHGRPHADAPV